jgi:cytochrome c-type biogenesis protein CcmH/NrfG
MKAESIVFAIAGSLFGLIVGWILGSQQTISTGRAVGPAAPQQQTGTQTAGGGQAQQPAQAPVLDENRVQAMRNVAEQNPRDPQPRVELGNMYFDAERFGDAITWYEEALKLNPADPNVSTDLGVAYYYTNQPDKAVAQFEKSLATDPKHTKTLLNLGIVKAFGKQDLSGAAAAWQQVVTLAPDSPEGQAAKKALEGLRSAHPTAGSGSE